MYSLKMSRQYVLDKRNFEKKKLEEIKQILTVRSELLDYTTDTPLEPIETFLEKPEFLIVPKYYGYKAFGGPNSDGAASENPIDLKFCGQLDPAMNQDQAVAKVFEALNSPTGTAYLSLPPGFGKTVCALYLVTKLKKKTLIVVHNTFLMKQWHHRITQYLPQAKVGIIRQKCEEYKDRDIVIAMLQTLLSRLDHFEKIMPQFDFLIVDEAHHLNATVFSTVLPVLSTRHMLMLSGTPERKGGVDKVLELWVGPVTYQVEKTYNYKVIVRKEESEYPLPPERVNRIGKYNLAKMITELCLVEERNKAIIKVLKECVEMSSENIKRGILVLSERIDHLKILDQGIKKLFPAINTLIFTRHTPHSVRDTLDKDSGKYQIIFSTYIMVSEGLDLKTLSILVFATPRANVVQASNRIMRGANLNYEPLIVDFVDKWDKWQKYWYCRRRYYLSQKFEIKYNASKDEMITQDITEEQPEQRKRTLCPFKKLK